MALISVIIKHKCERTLFLAMIDRLIADQYSTKN